MNEEIEKLKKKIEELEIIINNKKYGLNFKKVPEVFEEEEKNKIPILKEDITFAIDNKNGKPTNILIEGDNYHSLTCLNYTHKEKVDIIYIDPPYNTGSKDFKYNDRWAKKDDPDRHSKWLSFMEKRLILSKELLKDTGVIFISIDDNEMAQLKLLCDGIFGEENYICNFIWKKNNDIVRKNSDKILKMNEYILCYQKSNKFNGFVDKKKMPEDVHNPDKDARGNWFNANISNPVENKNSKNVFEVNINGFKITRRWFYDKDIIEKWILDNKIYLPIKNGICGIPRLKMFKEDFEKETKIANNLILQYSTSEGREELEKIFGIDMFSYPKPVELIKYLIKIFGNKNSVILDFFAGSGTTGQAVLELNKEDGGNRQFILCTNNEGNICTEVCYPRLQKVMQGYVNAKEEKVEVEGLGGSLSYFKTSFIGKHNVQKATDDDKVELALNSGELLAISENTLIPVEKNDYYQFFATEDKEKYTAIYFREEFDKFEEFKDKIEKLDKKTSVYVFSWGPEEFVDYFSYLEKVKVKSIFQPILAIYENVCNLGE